MRRVTITIDGSTLRATWTEGTRTRTVWRAYANRTNAEIGELGLRAKVRKAADPIPVVIRWMRGVQRGAHGGGYAPRGLRARRKRRDVAEAE